MSARGSGVRSGQCRVDPHAAEVALADHVGEEPQLAGGTGAFSLQAGGRQPGLLPGTHDQFVADGFDVVRDRVQERGVGFGVQGAERREGLGGRGRWRP